MHARFLGSIGLAMAMASAASGAALAQDAPSRAPSSR